MIDRHFVNVLDPRWRHSCGSGTQLDLDGNLIILREDGPDEEDRFEVLLKPARRFETA